MSDKDLLQEATEAFAAAEAAEQENREAARDDLRFARLGEQWPDKVKKDRERAARPCLTINRMPAFIRQVVNDARQNKPSIKVHPADSKADPETADIINGLIRNIEHSSNADVAYDTACDNAVTMGFGYWRVSIVESHGDEFANDLAIERIANPFSVYGDPNSTAADSSDWNCAFVTELMPEAEFEARYKGADKVDWKSDAYQSLNAPWRTESGGQDDVLVAEWWKRESIKRTIYKMNDGRVVDEETLKAEAAEFELAGLTPVQSRKINSWKITHRLMTGAEILETTEWLGQYIPIVPVYGEEVNFEGKRIFRSMVRDAKDPQMMFNYWRSLTTELVALAPKAPWIGPKGFVGDDIAKWETANIESHAFLEYEGGVSPQRQPFAGPPAGAIQEALSAADDMKSIMGIYDASLGARSNETSGRAIMARQREGDVSTFHFIDNLNRAIRHTGRILIDLIPKVYTGDRIIRVLGEDGTPATVPLNAQVPGEGGQMRVYDLALGKYDLTVTAGPSFTTRREEAATQMVELLRAFPQAAPYIGDLLAKNLDWPGADEIAKRMKALLPPEMRDEGQEDGIPPEVKQKIEQGLQVIQQQQQAMQQLAAENAQLKQRAEVDAGKMALDARKLDLEEQKIANDQMKTQAEAAKTMAEAAKFNGEADAVRTAAEITAASAAQVNAQVTNLLQIVPQILAQLTATQQAIVNAANAPKRKTAKAVRQTDGSYLMEAVEEPALVN